MGLSVHPRRLVAAAASVAVATALVLIPTSANADNSGTTGGGHSTPGHGGGHGGGQANKQDKRDLERYAADTWASFEAMTNETTGLPADLIDATLAEPSVNTSPTNIGGYLWSTVIARDLGVISKKEARDRMATTLASLETMERHEPSGMYYNWYSIEDGSKLTTWPTSGDVIYPFASSVDNGWLAAGLRVVASADHRLADQAQALYDSMDFGWFHDLDAREGASLNRGGFWVDTPGDTCTVPGNYGDEGPDVLYTCHWYDTTVSEARIATYLGIANDQIPETGYFGTYRTMPDVGCDFGWQEQKPTGETREYLGVSVYEGTYEYNGMQLVPAWGGSMFEALMPDLFVPEAEWGPNSWGINHPATVEAHRVHGMEQAGYGYWGFSPSSDPMGEYREYGVEQIGISADGYGSDVEKTDVDLGYEGCREATNPDPEFGDGVVTPHAAFLGIGYDKRAAIDNLRALETNFASYGAGGFYDAIAVGSGTVADRYLSLDQSMIMGAIGNALLDDRLKHYFVDRDFEQSIRPLVEMQTFGSRL